jgi:nucleoside-diphosphate-sugar epimerase
MAKISILGCGWLGIPLGKALAQSGHLVKGSTTTISKLELLKESNIEPYLFPKYFESNDLSEFLNSEILIISTPPLELEFWQKTVAEIEKSPIKKIILFSSTSVYEKSSNAITELSKTRNTTLAQTESYFFKKPNFETTILRFGGLIGKKRNPAFFFREGKKIKNPDSNVNLIHQTDCIRIVIDIIRQEAWGRIYNACSNSHPKKLEFYTKCAKDFNQPIPLADNASPSEKKLVDSNKLNTELNFKFVYDDLMNIAPEHLI